MPTQKQDSSPGPTRRKQVMRARSSPTPKPNPRMLYFYAQPDGSLRCETKRSSNFSPTWKCNLNSISTQTMAEKLQGLIDRCIIDTRNATRRMHE